MELLHPERRSVEPEELIGDLGLAGLAPPERPYVVLNMVSSADGKATLAGKSGGISGAADRRIFHLLRTQADAVLVGTSTVRREGYGRLTRSGELAQRRRAAGLREPQAAVLFTRTLDLPLDAGLFQDPESEVFVFTTSGAEPGDCPATVHVERQQGQGVDAAAALGVLRERCGVRTLLCEGGPALNATLFAAGCVDELFLTFAPAVLGGAGALTIVTGEPLGGPVRLDLVHAGLDQSSLFLRYRVA